MGEENIWPLASNLRKQRREATFGRGVSELTITESFRWDREQSAFVLERYQRLIFGSNHSVETYPCGLRTAHDILTFCLREDVQKRFFVSFKDDDELVVCDDELVTFSHSGSKLVTTRQSPLGELCWGDTRLQFYAPDKSVQSISLNTGLCTSLQKTLEQMTAKTVLEKLEGRQLECA